ncbi:hypothetical protein DFH06DRAFT_1147021 [Mycena polygramma]|nr:hypothetical protein DFH06DRAFT_1147021 [Mycena polygramma]
MYPDWNRVRKSQPWEHRVIYQRRKAERTTKTSRKEGSSTREPRDEKNGTVHHMTWRRVERVRFAEFILQSFSASGIPGERLVCSCTFKASHTTRRALPTLSLNRVGSTKLFSASNLSYKQFQGPGMSAVFTLFLTVARTQNESTCEFKGGKNIIASLRPYPEGVSCCILFPNAWETGAAIRYREMGMCSGREAVDGRDNPYHLPEFTMLRARCGLKTALGSTRTPPTLKPGLKNESGRTNAGRNRRIGAGRCPRTATLSVFQPRSVPQKDIVSAGGGRRNHVELESTIKSAIVDDCGEQEPSPVLAFGCHWYLCAGSTCEFGAGLRTPDSAQRDGGAAGDRATSLQRAGQERQTDDMDEERKTRRSGLVRRWHQRYITLPLATTTGLSGYSPAPTGGALHMHYALSGPVPQPLTHRKLCLNGPLIEAAIFLYRQWTHRYYFSPAPPVYSGDSLT